MIIEKYENHFDVDSRLYNCINDRKCINKVDTHLDIINYGFEEGLIYHHKQLLNLFPDIGVYEYKNNIFVGVSDKFIDIKKFVNNEIYSLDIKMYMNKFIIEKKINLLDVDLIVLVFIGNENIGFELMNKILQYKQIQKFGVGVCFRNKELYNKFKKFVLDNFDNFGMYISNEFGNDIIPTLLMYNKMIEKIKFEYVIKVHTKSNDIKWFNKCTNFLLEKNLEHLVLERDLIKKDCNCLGYDKCMINYYEDTKQNIKLKKKYKKYVNKKYFCAGTMFFSDSKLFDKILCFIENNNFRAYFVNNMYDSNFINFDNSIVHFLERLFGVIY